ncbi:K02A2.6-like [Cordylochernes scorpioides]|uniref:K02A2.6-like n=1 Tax=Cordylochernes scorpioides TaxID=51811 RepID=A0ABY6JX89_9ARAC|nr:K02A2.6-like [Cordylochernes scorpioides]
MAQIQPPETFDFSTPNEWPKWRKRFERYLVVSGMKKKEEADKIDLFMYLMGDRADDIFRTFKFEKEEEATKIDSVLKAFDSHFCVRKNIIYERAKFNSRIQEDREPVDEFITSLYKLADSCEFEGLREQLIRDRIVVGVRDKALSERMQLDSELTLEKAVKIVRQQEAVRQQQVDLQRPSTSQKVNQVKFNSKKQSPKQQQQPSRKKEKSAKTRSRCPKCGGFTHREGQACRAEGQRCNLCSKTGHFANCCPDKQAKTAEVKAVSELDEEIGFLLEVSAVEDSSNLDDDEGECRRRWTAEIQVNGKQVKFKLDSQADVTCVPLCLFRKIMGQQRLVESDINIRAAEFSELQTVGMFISTLRNGNYEIKEKIYVIRRLSEPLLSRRACELLNLARRIEVVATRINPIKEFPEVFEGLGQIGNPYEIKLKPGAKPYAVHTPRRVPIPLMEKLKTRLEELEKAGIIAQVNVATEWCAPTVIAGKPNGDIRLCVDLSRLNEHVQREVHPMPVVEHMLGQLGEARFFSKLDANSGFHQIPLSPDCQHLTTFITPFGRYKYCRMPFGISLAPEYFQRVMSIILQGMDGVMCYLDDILIFASDSKTHDRILRLVLRKLKEAKVTLNKAKCVFGVPRINFLGHILDEDGIRPDPAKIEAVARMPAPTDVHGVRRFLGMVNHLGRKRRTTLPIAPENLNPRLVDSQTLKRKEGRRRKDMKSRYDRRCGATDMEELSEGDTVWITDMRTWGIVKQKASTPRSYMVDTPVGTLRRNRFHLRKGDTVQYPADPSTPTFSGEELVENEKTPVVDYPSNDSEDGQIRTRRERDLGCTGERDLGCTGESVVVLNSVWMDIKTGTNVDPYTPPPLRNIWHEELGMRKLCARWVPHFLNEDQKQIRKRHSQQCLDRFKRDPTDFVRRFVPMDETRVHHYTPETKQQSM